jgi:hypothetical protein
MLGKLTTQNADWLTTVYNNQSDIGGTASFYTVGTHEAAPSGSGGSGGAKTPTFYH